jgi:hypothetical protein
MRVLDYNIQNGKGKKEDGKLDAVVAIFFHPAVGNPSALNEGIKNNIKGNGVVVDGSYGWTHDDKQKTVDPYQEGPFTPDRNTAYRLQYLMDFEVVTEGTGLGATQWMYRAVISPYALYFMK